MSVSPSPESKTRTGTPHDHWPAVPTPYDQRSPVRWTTGAKDGVGASVNSGSRVWFTVAGGIVTECFYPSVDQANTRRLLLVIVAGGRAYVEGERDMRSRVRAHAPWCPTCHISTRLGDTGLQLRKTVLTDPERSVVLQHVCLIGPGATVAEARCFAVLEPHLNNDGDNNDIWLGEYKGCRAVLARRERAALALLSSPSFSDGTCAYAGDDDALADLRAHTKLTVRRATAMSANVQAAVELPLNEAGQCTLALAFGESPDHAAQQARASLCAPFDVVRRAQRDAWRRYHRSAAVPRVPVDTTIAAVHATSVTVLRVHEDKERSGAIAASLAIPWGDAHGDRAAGGYHLVWPRDLVEAAGARLAIGLPASARRTLRYLMSTQDTNGGWPQNMWLDGSAHSRGVQLDEVALPILLASTIVHHGAVDGLNPWPMVRAAAAYIVRAGPITPEDRWEERGGYSPYTLATTIAALVVAARFATNANEAALSRYFNDVADYWSSSIERWTYVRDTALARRYDVDGYYVRLTPPDAVADGWTARGDALLRIPNHDESSYARPYHEIVSPDALALVRFGIRAADDPRIRNTIRVVDGELKRRTRRGPVWRRYTDDGYGEPDDGGPHIGAGIGRGWPLLTGERAHYEIARGRFDRAEKLRHAMAHQTSRTHLLPEQIWDAPDLPARALVNGRPTGSAMPLIWAHSEFLKLCRSLDDGRIFDQPPEVAERYGGRSRQSSVVIWRRDREVTRMQAGQTLRIEAVGLRSVSWRVAGSDRNERAAARDLGIGIAMADVETSTLPAGTEVRFRLALDEPAADVDKENFIRLE